MAARNLFQLSVRINPNSNVLWLEFFETEFKYLKGFTKTMPTVKTETQGVVASLRNDTELTEAQKIFKDSLLNNEVLRGQIPMIVYEFATKQKPTVK